jgi:RNA 2',3'-cyclic 3'-phosphodiesterase
MQFELGFAGELRRNGVLARKAVAQTRSFVLRSHPVLPGLEYRQIHNLFFALQLKGKAAAEAFAIPGYANLIGPWSTVVPLKNLHITFHSVAQQEGIPRSLIERASEAIGFVSASSFDVTFDRLENFALNPLKHALVLLCGGGLTSLTSLHWQIGEALWRAGFKHVGKSFVPHITLVYDTKPFAIPQIAAVSWRVNRFALIESTYGERRHEVRGNWMLSRSLTGEEQ